jgi:hypothetical protein
MRTVNGSLISLLLVTSLLGSITAQADGTDVGPLDLPGFATVNGESVAAACSIGSTGWDHCLHVWQTGSTTYCYLKSKKFWVRSSNDVSETAMIACAASTTKVSGNYSHYCLFNVTSCSSGYGDWNFMRIFEY